MTQKAVPLKSKLRKCSRCSVGEPELCESESLFYRCRKCGFETRFAMSSATAMKYWNNQTPDIYWEGK